MEETERRADGRGRERSKRKREEEEEERIAVDECCIFSAISWWKPLSSAQQDRDYQPIYFPLQNTSFKETVYQTNVDKLR